MKLFIIFLSVFYLGVAGAVSVKIPQKTCKGKPTVIAVIDTGFGAGWPGEENVKLCKFGHKDFSGYGLTDPRFDTQDEVPIDNHGHGTHIAGLIDKYARRSNVNYCIVVLKYYDAFEKDIKNSRIKATIKAIDYARNIHADYINYSSGGTETIPEEIIAVQKYINAGGIMISAAGNENSDLVKKPYFPAVDDSRVIVVGNLDKAGNRAKTSNYGDRIDRWEVGTGAEVFGVKMTGTSQAAAIATGKLVSESKNICK